MSHILGVELRIQCQSRVFRRPVERLEPGLCLLKLLMRIKKSLVPEKLPCRQYSVPAILCNVPVAVLFEGRASGIARAYHRVGRPMVSFFLTDPLKALLQSSNAHYGSRTRGCCDAWWSSSGGKLDGRWNLNKTKAKLGGTDEGFVPLRVTCARSTRTGCGQPEPVEAESIRLNRAEPLPARCIKAAT